MFERTNESPETENQERYQSTDLQKPSRSLGYNVVHVNPDGFEGLLRDLPQIQYSNVRDRTFCHINSPAKPSIYYRDGLLWVSFERIPNGRIVRTDNCQKESTFPDRITEKLTTLARKYI